ncbi:LolA-like outer membrane lipoprotein chaperone [Hydrogenimonas sp.]
MKKLLIAAFLAEWLMASLPVPKYFSADFTQVVQNKDTKKQLYYSGRLFMKMPDEAKWDYFIPLKKSICLTEHKAWVIEPELEQATLFRLNQSIPLLQILKSARKVGPDTYKAEYDGIDYALKVDKDKRISSVSYLDEMGNRVTLRFQNIETKPFDSSKLECLIPDGFDIIDGRY